MRHEFEASQILRYLGSFGIDRLKVLKANRMLKLTSGERNDELRDPIKGTSMNEDLDQLPISRKKMAKLAKNLLEQFTLRITK